MSLIDLLYRNKDRLERRRSNLSFLRMPPNHTHMYSGYTLFPVSNLCFGLPPPEQPPVELVGLGEPVVRLEGEVRLEQIQER